MARTSTSTIIEGPNAPWHVGGINDVAWDGVTIIAVGYVPIAEASPPGPFYRQAVWLGPWTG